MELAKRTLEEQAKIDRDQTLTHCAEIVDVPVGAGEYMEQAAMAISDAMLRIDVRSKEANMVVISTSISTNMSVARSGERHLTMTIMCQWVNRDKLEQMQRREALGGGGLPPRRGA